LKIDHEAGECTGSYRVWKPKPLTGANEREYHGVRVRNKAGGMPAVRTAAVPAALPDQVERDRLP